MKRIGIIGGIGPEATIDYYRIIIQRFRRKRRDAGSPEILIFSLDVKKSIQMMEADKWDELLDYILEGTRSLHKAGADFALVAANTPHIFFDELRAQSPLPLLSIVEETLAEAKRLKLEKVGLVGTGFTMKADFYQKVFAGKGISIVVPNPNERDYIHEKIMSELQFGIVVEETKRDIMAIVGRMIEAELIQGLIIGCTELPLIFGKKEFNISYLNTSRIHAESAVDYCLAGE